MAVLGPNIHKEVNIKTVQADELLLYLLTAKEAGLAICRGSSVLPLIISQHMDILTESYGFSLHS